MTDQANTLNLLSEKIREIDGLKTDRDESKLVQWKAEINMILEKLLGEESKYVQQFNSIDYLPHVWTPDNKVQRLTEAFQDGLDEAKGLLNSIIFGVQKSLI